MFLKANSGIGRNATLLFCIAVRDLIPQMRKKSDMEFDELLFYPF
jgi:hypothetical protein